MNPGGERTLHTSRDLRFGIFTCPPGDRRWDEVNLSGERPYLVFPQERGITIAQEGRQAVLATPAQIMVYPAGQRFRRSPAASDRDRCVFVDVSEQALADAGISSALFADPCAPCDPRTYLLQHHIVQRLLDSPGDPLDVEEDLHLLLRRIAAITPSTPMRARARARTARAHRTLVEDAKTLVADRLSDPVTLDDLARSLAVSAGHLARVFRAVTGMSLHAYRTTVRTRLALTAVRAFERDLASLAADLGFASHSHLTETFRRTFGLPPSRIASIRKRSGS